MTVPHVLVANGVNLDLLGRREPNLYGRVTLQDLERDLSTKKDQIAQLSGFKSCELSFFQSNMEGEFLHKLSAQNWDGVILNPGAWTHTSLALADRLSGLQLKFVEVHLTNLYCRETFRQKSYSAPSALGVMMGVGPGVYHAALLGLLKALYSA